MCLALDLMKATQPDSSYDPGHNPSDSSHGQGYERPLSLMSHQVGEMCWAIDWIIELQPLVEQFEGVDTARHVTGRHVDPLEQRLLQPVGQGLAYFRIAVT